jgi:hypothetical protein
MIAKKVTRYYSDCGRGFWKKEQAVNHDENCKCWVNPKFQCCLSCNKKNIVKDSNGMESEPQFLQKWDTNLCKYSELGVPVHENFEHIRKYCPYYENKKTS